VTNLAGGHLSPYDGFFFLASGGAGKQPPPEELRRAVSESLAALQGPDGSWAKRRDRPGVLFLPTSYYQRMQALEPVGYKADKLKDADLEAPHVWLAMKTREQKWATHTYYGARSDVLATTLALMALTFAE
jgi:hypothetical protein